MIPINLITAALNFLDFLKKEPKDQKAQTENIELQLLNEEPQEAVIKTDSFKKKPLNTLETEKKYIKTELIYFNSEKNDLEQSQLVNINSKQGDSVQSLNENLKMAKYSAINNIRNNPSPSNFD